MTTRIGGVIRQKVCPSCHEQFECAAGGCWCDEVELTDRMRTTLREQYDNCLCPSCLRAMREHQNANLESSRSRDTDLLMIQFLGWVAERPRTYADVMEAWRTSCPRQSVWEDAQADGLVAVGPHTVTLTARGEAALDRATG
jgi:hypothetical protein